MSGRDVNHILVLRFSSLGDIVMLTPTLRALRKAFPDARIDLAVRSDFASIVENNPHIDKLFTVDRKDGIRGLCRLFRELRNHHFDLLYDAHFSIRSVVLSLLLGATHRARFQKHYLKRSIALTFKIRCLLDTKRTLERYIEPLEKFGVFYDGFGPQIQGTMENAPAYVGLIPSAQWPGKRWAPEKFRRLLELFLKNTSWKIAVFGGTEDTFCQEITRGTDKKRVFNFQGKLTLPEVVTRLKECYFVVANDTGLMHMADALGVPSVVILGPTSAGMGCLPFDARSKIVENELWCRPCSKNGQALCIRGHRLCLDIEPQRVFDAALTIDNNIHLHV